MWWKQYGLVVGLVLVAVGASDVLPAAAQGIQGVVTAGQTVKDTVQSIVYMVGSLFIIGGVLDMRHGASFGNVAITFLAVIVIVAIALFADEIIAIIKPGAAAGWTIDTFPHATAWNEVGQVVEQWGWLALGTMGIRRLRR